MLYEQRIVAFIDILGFKSLLNDTIDKNGNDDEEAINMVISAYNAIRDIWDLDKKSIYLDTKSYDTKKVSIFSDCLVISFEINQPSEVFFTLLEIKWLIMRLIARGMLCRGAVTIGKFIHTDHYLFGPALVEAYTLESKAAMYPRVILESSVIDAGIENKSSHHTPNQEKEYVQALLEQDSDGMYYIDYFFKAQSELDDPDYDFPDYIENLANIIRKGLMGSSHPSKADIRVKYSWMRERYNNMIDIVKNESTIKSLRENNEFELADLYSKLKKISPNKYSKNHIR
ncbi:MULTISPECIES: hypothetical protein [Aeromonas]|uniref:hypothetical protein n=1 Tax=Aeromonas TaxID=642 RepID=UPI002259C5B9|nr:hypothetical protein [Aeromonas caviae]MCX4034149.1 hypothetical protein [Aeromonas caviae]MEE1913911.1 hypothetical protein [Aeromonas caviae]